MTIGVQLRNNLGSEETATDGTTVLPGFSSALWSDCPIDSIRNGTIQGVIVEPPLEMYESTATTVENMCGLPTFEGDCTMNGVAKPGGGVALFGTTDNEEASLAVCGATSSPFIIPADSATGKKLWFEVEVKKSIITVNTGGFFVGLTSEGAAVADFIADGGADFSDVDLLGFWNLEGEANVDVITQKTGAAFDTIIDAAEVLVADTYTRLGFVYNPNALKTQRIKFYVNGLQQTTYVGEDDGDATVYLGDTTNFPGGEEMGPVIALKMASANDLTVTLRKLRCVQLL